MSIEEETLPFKNRNDVIYMYRRISQSRWNAAKIVGIIEPGRDEALIPDQQVPKLY